MSNFTIPVLKVNQVWLYIFLLMSYFQFNFESFSCSDRSVTCIFIGVIYSITLCYLHDTNSLTFYPNIFPYFYTNVRICLLVNFLSLCLVIPGRVKWNHRHHQVFVNASVNFSWTHPLCGLTREFTFLFLGMAKSRGWGNFSCEM